ncbi:glycosyl hydrolase [Artemisia annua]|uniref:Glycosyl hydrolase n=1 Tax=Artemisia annua TaxID=35608 RepID=A0A2U1MDK8_ARTAN|nr:glycosyl hydrolase [Artemisia annua]
MHSGPMYYNGVYNIFYQYNPPGPHFSNQMHWAHFVSLDLINWMPLDLAFSPTEPFDVNSCWSGSATVLPGDKPVMLYTGSDSKNQQSFPRTLWLDGNQTQLIQWLIEEIEMLYENKVSLENKKLEGGSLHEVVGITAVTVFKSVASKVVGVAIRRLQVPRVSNNELSMEHISVAMTRQQVEVFLAFMLWKTINKIPRPESIRTRLPEVKNKKGGRLVCRCVDRSDTENNFGFSQVKTRIKRWQIGGCVGMVLSQTAFIKYGPITSYLWPYRAEELETTFMEMAQQDNRRELSTRAIGTKQCEKKCFNVSYVMQIEYMEEEVLDLQQVLAYKKEQEKPMLEVLMRVEQEQKVTEDVRISAERDAAAQRYLASVLQIQLLMITYFGRQDTSLHNVSIHTGRQKRSRYGPDALFDKLYSKTQRQLAISQTATPKRNCQIAGGKSQYPNPQHPKLHIPNRRTLSRSRSPRFVLFPFLSNPKSHTRNRQTTTFLYPFYTKNAANKYQIATKKVAKPQPRTQVPKQTDFNMLFL